MTGRYQIPKLWRTGPGIGRSQLFRAGLALAALGAVLAGSHTLAGMRTDGCMAGTAPGVRAELLLGRNTGQVLGVTTADFQGFVEREVAPRFPDGFTIQDASGQWRDEKAAEVVREPSFALMIVLQDGAAAAPRLKAIADAYKIRFQQQSVLVSVSRTCFAL